MSERNEVRTDERVRDGYLSNPHYYRLGYQLAAQYANWLLSERTTSSDEPQRAARAMDVAARVSREARTMIDTYERRRILHRRWKFWGPRKLQPTEKRLLRFLKETVEPSAELICAGLYVAVFADYERAEMHAQPIRERAEDPNDDLSYRAIYNLACYETSRGKAEPEARQAAFVKAISYLSLAFRRTHGRPREEIVRWANSDPALAPLKRTDEFKSLISRYAPPEVSDEPRQDKSRPRLGRRRRSEGGSSETA
jgi:hypothetical protein